MHDNDELASDNIGTIIYTFYCAKFQLFILQQKIMNKRRMTMVWYIHL